MSVKCKWVLHLDLFPLKISHAYKCEHVQKNNTYMGNIPKSEKNPQSPTPSIPHEGYCLCIGVILSHLPWYSGQYWKVNLARVNPTLQMRKLRLWRSKWLWQDLMWNGCIHLFYKNMLGDVDLNAAPLYISILILSSQQSCGLIKEGVFSFSCVMNIRT